jgi:hypothetical protein
MAASLRGFDHLKREILISILYLTENTRVFIRKTNRVILFKKIVAVYCENNIYLLTELSPS